ncbi:hypothetical protein MPSEU_000258100 [Mayamaea pseudoterrestris]|nr:hypothetical protein MPSEU_000258100 [Mayamaea pseudoterrestris]
MGFLSRAIADQFEKAKPAELDVDIRMISGCDDHQTSADVSNVKNFKLPNAAGHAGGACTSTLLSILYKDEKTPKDTLSFVQVLEKMRKSLSSSSYTQIPQMTSSKPIDMKKDFDLVPPSATGTRRAVMIGINYVGHETGELKGCHFDTLNMKRYIQKVHKFKPDNIQLLLDDGEQTMPTRANILKALKKMVAAAEPGDALFVHYSGHGAKMKDDTGDEHDGYDETLVPVDYDKGVPFIRDDDLYDILVKPMPKGAHLFCLFDCCHSGTVLDLPYQFKPGRDNADTGMQLLENFDYKRFMSKLGTGENAVEFLMAALKT